jgi:hypothetical protein
MAAIKQEYKQYLNATFKDQKIIRPLFFNGNFGLRFDLQVGETDTEEYFMEAIGRSSSLFKAAFDPNDIMFLIFRDFKWKRRKIGFLNYCLKQINNLERQEVNYSLIRNHYEIGTYGVYNAALTKLAPDRVNYKNILTAISNTDFPPRQPRFKFLSSVEIYFINATQNLIFHMYDDRGLDIMASDIETLKPIYTNFNDWILESNRKKIDEMMSGKS